MTEQEYNNTYHLSKICGTEKELNNIINWLKMRDLLVQQYNSNGVPVDIKPAWIQNITIVTASIIEAMLYSACDRLVLVCDKHKCDKRKCKCYQIHKNKNTKWLNDVNYVTLINNICDIGLLKIDAGDIQSIRKMRNGVHIVANKVDIRNIAVYKDAKEINKVIQLSKLIADNLNSNFNHLRGDCIKTSPLICGKIIK